MHTKLKVLMAAGTVALACAGASAATLPPPGADYPWVQPAWVGSSPSGVVPTASRPGAQLPASIPPFVSVEATVGSSYHWVQLPAWVGTAGPAALPTASYPWVQPPAWIPIQ
jgi:hypothetical protein